MKRPDITPGPWIQNRKISRMIHTEQHDQICEVDGLGEIPKEQEQANARAIAAIPAMLSALEDCMGALRISDDAGLAAYSKTRAALVQAGYTF